MASPLSPAPEAALNSATPQTTKRFDSYEIHKITSENVESRPDMIGEDTAGSSPFVSCVDDTVPLGQENVSPTKARRDTRVLSGNELSPLKILSEQTGSESNRDAGREAVMGAPPLPHAGKSPRKMSPERRFPVKISGVSGEYAADTSPPSRTSRKHQREISLDEAVRENEGLKKAIEVFEDERSTLSSDHEGDVHMDQGDEPAGADDTMVSTFSTFSAVPSMTMFARLGQTPRGRLDTSPSMRTPRAGGSLQEPGSGSTMNLLDFTESLRHPQQKSPGKRGNLAPSRTTPNVAATPNRHLSNLIDFDIPPMPTPRSVPTITPRELESLKSGFLSEISSLKASLSGKEAEVHSLKTAVGDAEKRVGESMEKLREEGALREQLAAEKQDWECRGREMESVLRKAKEEIEHGQREREQLEQKLDESEKRREAAEMMAQEAESKMAGMRAGKDSSAKSSPDKAKSPTAAAGSNKDVEIAVERVARDLHALYKSKHETKVAALKKSYESRWEKKVKELETRVNELGEENDKLRVGRDATMTKLTPTPSGGAVAEEAERRKVQAVKDSAAIKELHADVHRLEAVVETVQRDNGDLRVMLERERVEKGELVQLAEEMMSMQSFVGASSSALSSAADAMKTPRPVSTASAMESFRSSIGRSGGSGLRAPGSAVRSHDRGRSTGGLPRPGVGGGVTRSGIMNSIEKMGSYRGRGGD